MTNKGQYTFKEITTQPEAWADTIRFLQLQAKILKKTWGALHIRQVLFTGCGSTHYLSQASAALFQGFTGVPARACPASELLLFGPQVVSRPEETLLVAVSRSGTTSETLSAVDRFRSMGGQAVWGVTCYPEETLAQEVDQVLIAESAQEQSIAQTRSFASMLLLIQGLTAIVSGESLSTLSALPDLGRSLIQETDDLALKLGGRTDFTRFYFLGSGVQYGLANEAMLKMKEMSLSISEGYHFLEFRHGPISMVESGTLAIGLLSREAHLHEAKLLSDVGRLGAHTLALSPVAVKHQASFAVSLPLELPSWALPILYLPPLQLLAFYRAIEKGLDPDNPRNLEAVVYLNNVDYTSD